MAERPEAELTIDDEAGAQAGTTGYIVVLAAVAQNDDCKPRVFGSAKSVIETHKYSQGAAYVAQHIDATQKPVIFCGLPIATAGAIGRQNDDAVDGSCAITVAAGSDGVLEEVDAIVTVTKGGTIGTDQIALQLSLDGGRTNKPVRLGTASSYTIPYVGITLNFGAGTLVAEDEFTFSTTAPMWDNDGLTAARVKLAAQQKLARSAMVIGDLPSSTFAGYVTGFANTYETASDRFIYARAGVRDRLPIAEKSKVRKEMRGAPNLTFAEVGGTGDTITRSSGSWIADGFAVGDVVTVALSVSNNVTGPIASLSATVLTFGTTDLAAEGPVAGCTVVGSEALTFAEVGGTGDTLTRSAGSWLADGFRAGDVVAITGTSSNNVTGAIASLTATVLTFGTTDLAAEVIGSHNVTIMAGETMAQWVASMDSEFAGVDDQKRIDLGLGRLRKTCPITGWAFRRNVQWSASCREYQHDVHIPTWRKADGPLLDWSNLDEDEQIEEYDERNDSGALAARFTCSTTYSNGPNGAFIALSLTRALEGSLLSRTHNMAVTNVACTVCHAETENAIGQVLVLQDDGKGTEESLVLIEERVNSQLQMNLLQNKGEGQRASKAVWKASRQDILNVPGAELTGTMQLLLNGTLEKIKTRVRIQTAGA